MRSALVAVVLGISLFGTRPAPAAPFTSAFDDLRVELETRRDNDFGGTLDAAKKKQQKAVLKSLALIDRPAADLGSDIKTAGAVDRVLEKAFAEEFSLPVPLPALMDVVLADLYNATQELRTTLTAKVGRLVPSPVSTRAQRSDDAAAGFLSVPTIPRAPFAQAMFKAWKQIVKGLRSADKGELLPLPAEFITFIVDGTPYQADVIVSYIRRGDDGFEILGNFTDPGTMDIHAFRAVATGVLGGGLHGLFGAGGLMAFGTQHPDMSQDLWVLDAGTIDFGTWDLATPHVAGHVELTATGGPGMTTVTVIADFDVSTSIQDDPGTTPE